MRPFEIIILFLLAVYTLWPLISGSARLPAVNWLPALATALVFVHLFTEGYRWQMVPSYVLCGTIQAASLPGLLHPPTGDFQRLSWSGAGLAGTFTLLVVATALPALLPVPTVTPPSGPYRVGTRTFVLTDGSRRELYSGKDEPRKFMVQVWYPANPNPGDENAPWMANAEIVAPAIAEYIHLPGFFLNHLTLAKTASFQDAPFNPEGAPYPVLVFSHGWNGFRAQSTFLMQELASYGYFVIGMEHTYGARITVFPDGQVAPNNPSALPISAPEEEYEAAARLLVDQWARDIGFVLDTFQARNISEFDELLDFSRLGVLGHSTGGGAAIQFCGTDARCQAALVFDPFMAPVSLEVLSNGLSQPFAAIFSQVWTDDFDSKNNRLFNMFREHTSKPAAAMSIEGSAHYDFSDLPALTPLAPKLHLKGPINGQRVHEIIDTYALAFFEYYFRGKPISLLDGSRPEFPEIRFLTP